jgi:hypothetical protein
VSVNVTENRLIEGDAVNPESTDIILQKGSLAVGKPVPDGWRVLTGNNFTSEVWRVAHRYEIEEEHADV